MTVTDPSIIRPHDALMLCVGDGHWLYFEKVGRAGGVPALFLHGGPGSGAQHSHRNVFDRDRFAAVLFDQRGSGRSHPYLSRLENTTQKQISDIEQLRTFLGIDRWFVVGGSWGSTLAIAYAEAHPERVLGLVLRAVFLGTDDEVQWAFADGPKTFRPDLYQRFVDFLDADERGDPVAAYVNRLTNPDPSVHGPAAHVWHGYERALSVLSGTADSLSTFAFSASSPLPPTPLMEAHYIKNHFFLEPGQLLKNAGALKSVPGIIVQGRYDLLCPPRTAHALARRWPACDLRFIETAGHAMTEPGVTEAMRSALNELADRAVG